ncbi:hypothetical protein [Nocardia asiatica]|uniref:hypothetical protein n=1 Tax=Nocardia asiatica TaxID=209252 RepID=UPI002454A94D|nr:hypothetical protein [Nocardia asiatica]
MRRWRWLRAALCSVVLAAGGCIGAVERGDFEQDLRARGGGLVNGLTESAVAAVRERLRTSDFEAHVILLTAPNSTRFRVVLSDQPDQVTRFFSAWPDPTARQAVVRLRVRDPEGSRRLDDYSFTLGALSAPRPVRVSVFDDIDAEGFAISEVPGLAHIEGIVDTALARSALADGEVTVMIVSRFGREIRIVANVTSPRADVVAEFDRTGAFLRIQQV